MHVTRLGGQKWMQFRDGSPAMGHRIDLTSHPLRTATLSSTATNPRPAYHPSSSRHITARLILLGRWRLCLRGQRVRRVQRTLRMGTWTLAGSPPGRMPCLMRLQSECTSWRGMDG